MLTAFAESDFDTTANDRNQSFSVFQQSPPWWPHAYGTMREQLNDFLNSKDPRGLRNVPKQVDPVIWAWQVQGWTWDLDQAVVSPFGDAEAVKRWRSDKRTANYYNRLTRLDLLISDENYFRSGKS